VGEAAKNQTSAKSVLSAAWESTTTRMDDFLGTTFGAITFIRVIGVVGFLLAKIWYKVTAKSLLETDTIYVLSRLFMGIALGFVLVFIADR